MNPAFSRFHPRLNVVYTCTEDIEHNGIIIAYDIHCDGSLTEIGRIDAGGTSTCYLTIDREQAHIIACNYWDSTLVVIPLSTETGEFIGPIHNVYDPKCGQKMIAAAKKHGGVNHSNNDASTVAQHRRIHIHMPSFLIHSSDVWHTCPILVRMSFERYSTIARQVCLDKNSVSCLLV